MVSQRRLSVFLRARPKVRLVVVMRLTQFDVEAEEGHGMFRGMPSMQCHNRHPSRSLNNIDRQAEKGRGMNE